MTAPSPDADFLRELREFAAVANAKLAEIDAPAAEEPAPAPPVSPSNPNAVDQEPVVIAHAVTTILSALVAFGWATIPGDTITIIGTVLAFVLSCAGVVMARAKVSPVNSTWWDVVSGYVTDLVKAEILRGMPKV
jgi:hypothetical protein